MRAWTQEVYVWQRRPSAELATALREQGPRVDGLCCLAAEVSWVGGGIRIARPELDYATLRTLRRPIGLALRIGSYGGGFAVDDATARALATLAGELIVAARTAGVGPVELQIDFDCAESKLAGYRAWLEALRRAAGKTPLVFTALPAWLKHEEFRELARAADRFVLQVHSLEKPAGPDEPFTLCDPERARAWVRQAAEIGVPFRVALPTYGYVLAFDAAGKFLALAAENQRAWPAGARLRTVRADAPAMARLAQTLAADPPPGCTGVIWFRLPVAGDRLNWDAATFATVLRGDVPVARLAVKVTWPEPGLAEITIANTGQMTELLPAAVTLRWPEGARVLAGDGLGGFRLEIHDRQAQGMVRAADVPADASLAPGRNVRIAWLRFSHEISLEAFFPAAP